MPPGAFDNSCSWPRRLLHIQTLRSYEWQPGNIYGGYRNPGYNALSYTWGRWQLCEDEPPEISAIRVKGTSWSIPRIDPAHFTAEKFAAVIADTADPHPSETDASGVDFLWLDVACIDQSPESREKAQDSMGLLTAAGNRTTRHEEDRVYGIMQVFEFQLGNSASDIDENGSFSLEELNDQLGSALLEKHPILSLHLP